MRAVIGVTGQFAAVDDLLTGEENLQLMADLHHLPAGEADLDRIEAGFAGHLAAAVKVERPRSDRSGNSRAETSFLR